MVKHSCFHFIVQEVYLKILVYQVNLSSAMATQALYHSQKNFGKEGQSTTNKPEDLAITAM